MGNNYSNAPISKGPDGAVDWNGNEVPYNKAGGNGGGFVGFNPDDCLSEIQTLQSAFQDIKEKFLKAHFDLMDEQKGLYYVWCSPNAVKFAEELYPKVQTLFNRMDTEFSARLTNARRAYNIIAGRNNWPECAVAPFMGGGEGISLGVLLERHPNGKVGINPTLAGMVKDSYHKNMADCVDALKKAPKAISFYDESGAQAEAYSNKIDELALDIAKLLIEIEATIKVAIENEVHDDQLAKQQVVTTLNA